jgi:O-antigen/teichoic acid export membrane protein
MVTRTSQESSFWRGAGFTLFARSLQVVYGLLSIPLGVRYFGSESFGAWLVIASVVSYLNMASFGAPHTVLTWTARRMGGTARSVFRRGFAVAMLISLACLAGLGAAALVLPIGGVAAIVGSADPEVGRALVVMTLGTLLLLPLGTATASLAGQGRVDLQQMVQAAHLVANLVALLLAIGAGTSLVGLAGLTITGRAIVALGGIALRARVPFPASPVKPPVGIGETPDEGLRGFVSSSARFFIIGLQYTVTMNLDQLIVAHAIGPSAVPGYVAVLRLVQGLELAVTSVLAPAWPAFGRLLTAGVARESVSRVLSATLHVSQVTMILIALPMTVLAPTVFHYWLGDASVALTAEDVLLPLLGWSVVHVSIQVQTTFLHAADRTGWQAIIGGFDGGLNLLLSLWLVGILGPAGVALATLVAAVMLVYPGLSILVRAELGRPAFPIVKREIIAGLLWPALLLVLAAFDRIGSTPATVAVTVLMLIAILAAQARRVRSSYATLKRTAVS